MAYRFELVAEGELGTANGGGAFSQTYDYKLIVPYTWQGKICIATRQIDNPLGVPDYPWVQTTVFDHSAPAGGGATADVTSPPVLWVARSGRQITVGGTTQAACRFNVIHMAWGVRYTSGPNNGCYQIFHAMRGANGVWTCAAGTLASLNAVTAPSATTGIWQNPQLLGLRRWNSGLNRYEGYGQGNAESTLYLTYHGRQDNTGYYNIYMTKFGVAAAYDGNDWDTAQTWKPAHFNMTQSTDNNNDIKVYHTLSKVAWSTAKGQHTSGTDLTHQYITVGYTRKGIAATPTSFVGHACAYRTYTPHTDTVSAELDAHAAAYHATMLTSITKNHSVWHTNPAGRAYYLYDNLIVCKGWTGSSYYNSASNGWWITGNLTHFDNNRNSFNLDGWTNTPTPANSNLGIMYGHLRWRQYTGDINYVAAPYAIGDPQHVTTANGDQVAADMSDINTGAITRRSVRTGALDTVGGFTQNLYGLEGFVAAYSHNYPGYDGYKAGNGTDVNPPSRTADAGSSLAYGTRHRMGDRPHIFVQTARSPNNLYNNVGYGVIAPQSPYGTEVTYPQFAGYYNINPILFRTVWFQDGTEPRYLNAGWAMVFENYRTDKVDNKIWMTVKTGSTQYYNQWENTWDGTPRVYDPYTAEPVITAPHDNDPSMEYDWEADWYSLEGYTYFPGQVRRRTVFGPPHFERSNYLANLATPTYSVNFDLDLTNADGLVCDRWYPEYPRAIHYGISQYGYSVQYIGFSVVNHANPGMNTVALSAGVVSNGTIEFALGSVTDQVYPDAYGKAYSPSITLDVSAGRREYIWIKWTPNNVPPGNPPNPATPTKLDMWLKFEQVT